MWRPTALAAVDLRAPPEGSINAFLIDSRNGALYGACCGHLLQNLRATSPIRTTKSFLTHLHVDHVGGVMADGKMAFPNAIVRVSKRDANHWLNDANEKAAPAALTRRNQRSCAQPIRHPHSERSVCTDQGVVNSAGAQEG